MPDTIRMQVSYSGYTEKHKGDLFSMIKSLYCEPGGQTMTDEKIRNSIDFLGKNPGHGRIVMIQSGENTIGYSILLNYWSNEFGGFILIVDELFIKKEYRGKGTGTEFLRFLMKNEDKMYKAIQLEVYPSNIKALQLYTRLGFEKSQNNFLRTVL